MQETPTEPPVRPIRAMKVGDVRQIEGRIFPGRAKATQEVNLAFEVSGTLNQMLVQVGDKVKQGQLIASLDARDYQSNLNAAVAQLDKSRANFKRAQDLIKKNFISQVEFDRLKATVRVDVAEAEKARKALADTKIIAPFSGDISETFAENYQSVQPKQNIVRLVDISRIEIVVDIPDSLISLVPYAKNVKAHFDAFPDRQFAAGIKEIGKEASQTTRTYPVTLIMTQPDDITILPGMSAKVTGEPPEEGKPKATIQGIVIPLKALFSPGDDGKNHVWVIDENTGTVSLRQVSIAQVSSKGVLIDEGLRFGEWIALAGVHVLREGQRVRLMQDQEV